MKRLFFYFLSITLLLSNNLNYSDQKCFGLEDIEEGLLKNIQTDRKIVLVNNLRDAIAFEFGIGLPGDEGIDYDGGFLDVPANSQREVPYCWLLPEKVVVKDFKSWGFKKDFRDFIKKASLGIETGRDSRFRPMNLIDTFKKLRNRKAFNLIITINSADKDPVVEVR